MAGHGVVGIIGCGSIGRRHALNAARIFGPERVHLADAETGTAARLAADIGARAYGDPDAFFGSGLKAAIVATPHASHVDLARRAIAAGADVLVEKPIALEQGEADALVAEAAASGRKLFVACNMRFHPGIAALRDGLSRIGRPVFARALYGSYLPEMRTGVDYRDVYSSARANGGGVIFDSIHEFDYLLSFFGPVSRVVADAATSGRLDIDVEDHAVSMLRHDSGMRSTIHLDFLRRAKLRGCEVVGSEATIEWASCGKRPERYEVMLSKGDTRERIACGEVDPNEPYLKMLEAFDAAIEGRSSAPLATGAEGAEALAVALAAHRAVDGRAAIPRGTP